MPKRRCASSSPRTPNADALFYLGSIAVDRGRLSVAEPLLRRALAPAAEAAFRPRSGMRFRAPRAMRKALRATGRRLPAARAGGAPAQRRPRIALSVVPKRR